MSLLKVKYPGTSLCMVGPDKGLLEAVKQMAATEELDVVFIGRQSKKEWAALSRGYDIFINTSHIDNMPFSVIEAMSLGMAVVSTNVGGIPHLLTHGENAMLVPDGDFHSMAESVAELMENESLRTSILKQSEALVAQSSWENVRDKWLEILV